jgi:uncharacterized protein YkwD
MGKESAFAPAGIREIRGAGGKIRYNRDVSRHACWVIGLSLLLAGCAVNPVTPPAVVDVEQQTAALASPSPKVPTATDVPVTGAGLPTQTEPASSAAAITAATASPAARPMLAALPAASVATGSPTPALIVVANVGLVPAPTATKPPVVVSVARPKPTAAARVDVPPPAPTAVPPAALAPPLSADVAAAEQYTVDLINVQRAALGLAPLSADATLMGIANSRVADMVARGYTGHNDPTTGVALGPALMKAAGFGLVGENWYGSRLGPPTIADVAMRWFMTDAPHYQNILNPRYSGVGVGIAYNGQQWLLVQDFAGS